MSELVIDAERLKTVRKARKMGRPKLARLSGVSERQVARMETAHGVLLSEALVMRLSDALGVPHLTLTGELPLRADDLVQLTKPKCTNGCCG